LTGSSLFTLYVTSVYWSTITILTVGYGDISPTTDTEKVFCVITSLFTIGVYAYIINRIGTIFKEMNDKT
jgi:voltage-gated potassium channel Kch